MDSLLKRINDRISDAARGGFSNAELLTEIAAIQQVISYNATYESIPTNTYTDVFNQLKTYVVHPPSATFSNDLPIKPDQAFVDSMPSFLIVHDGESGGLPLGSKFITSISPTIIGQWTYACWKILSTAGGYVDLSNNNLDQDSVDGILAQINVYSSNGYAGNLDLSGGTNAVPTGGQSNPDLIAIRQRNWIVATN